MAALTLSQLQARVLAPVDLQINAGELVFISGPSGSGKSLLLRAIADLDPNQGEVLIDDRPRASIPAPEWRRRVGLLPAESGWWSDRVGDHFTTTARMRPAVPPAALKTAAASAHTGTAQVVLAHRAGERASSAQTATTKPTAARNSAASKSADADSSSTATASTAGAANANANANGRQGENQPLPQLLAGLGFQTDVLDWDIQRLSTGERQRLALARLLLNDPEVLLLDEATANLDPTNREHAEQLIDDYRRQRRAAVLWASHDPDQRQRLAQTASGRCFTIDSGQLIPERLD